MSAVALVENQDSNIGSDVVAKLSEAISLDQRRIVAETASRNAYLSELDNAEDIGKKRGRAMARKALLAQIPNDMNEFHTWANQ